MNIISKRPLKNTEKQLALMKDGKKHCLHEDIIEVRIKKNT